MVFALLDFLKKPEIYKFLIVGIFGAISVLLLTVFFTSFVGIFYIISVVLAFEITLIWAFFAHDKWTFAHVKKTSKTGMRLIKFNLFSLISLGINELVLVILTIQAGFHYITGESIAIVVAFFFNYIISKKITFKY